MLRDTQPGEAGVYEELSANLDAPPPAAPEAAAAAAAETLPAASSMDVDEGPELEMPAPFEVSQFETEEIRDQADTEAIAVSIRLGLEIKRENMYEDGGTLQPNESFTKYNV